jgi:hypothetical protein
VRLSGPLLEALSAPFAPVDRKSKCLFVPQKFCALTKFRLNPLPVQSFEYELP